MFDDDRDEELNITSTDSEDEEELAEADRGDELPDEPSEEDLKRIAGEDDEGQQPESDESDEGEEAGGRKGGSSYIPYSRFAEINERRIRAEERARLLEEELQRAKGAAQPAAEGKPADDKPAFDFDAKEEEYAQALMDGDTKLAAAIRKEINDEIRRQAEEQAAANAEMRLLARQAQEAFQKAVTESIEKYPFLDKNSPQAHPKAISEVVEWRDFYISKGKSPAEALRQAVKRIAPAYAGGSRQGDADDEGVESPRNRLKAALERNANHANRQPARLAGGVGDRSDAAKLHIEDLSDDEFDALPEKVKRQLRGDGV